MKASLFVLTLAVLGAVQASEGDYKAGEAVHAAPDGSDLPEVLETAFRHSPAHGHHSGHHPGHHTALDYAGVCAVDGYFLHDAYSFVMCSNGKAHLQHCAPGTRNNPSRIHASGHASGQASGHAYLYTDFCNENLNDHGAGLEPVNHYHGYAPLHYGYGWFPRYGGYYDGYHPYAAAGWYGYRPFLAGHGPYW